MLSVQINLSYASITLLWLRALVELTGYCYSKEHVALVSSPWCCRWTGPGRAAARLLTPRFLPAMCASGPRE